MAKKIALGLSKGTDIPSRPPTKSQVQEKRTRACNPFGHYKNAATWILTAYLIFHAAKEAELEMTKLFAGTSI